jgi:uncharacterized membrane protein
MYHFNLCAGIRLGVGETTGTDGRIMSPLLTWEMAMSEDISRQPVKYQDANNVDKLLLHAVLVSSLLLANT